MTDETVRAALQDLSQLRRALSLESTGAPQPEVLQTLLGAAHAYAGTDAKTALFLVNEADACLTFVASEGLSPEYAQAVDNARIGPDSIPCGRAAFLGERVIVPDISRDPAWAGYLNFARQQSIHACWSFPLSAQGHKVVGVLAVYFPAPQPPESARIEMMEFLAQCAALAIERFTASEERRKFEAQLRQSESRYRSLTHALTSIVWTTDAQGRFAAPQEAWQKYTGQGWEQQQGYGWLQAVHPDDREGVLAPVLKALEGKRYFQAGGRLWHEDSKTHRHCEARGVPMLADDGEVAEWVGTCVDVHERKEAEESLRLADRRKDEFIAVLAHELRNPLAPIRNAIHIIRTRGAADAQLSWASTVVERQVGQMARLLDDLLDVSRITRDMLELQKSRVALAGVIESAVETSRPMLEQHGHRFELQMPPTPVYLDADAARLTQVFSNLLNNAAKYTDRGGHISLTLRADDKEAVVSVKDNGIGIEPGVLPKLFNRFSQAAPALERAQGGLGIGLSLVRGLVELHGGTVHAFSEGLGRGSEFVVHLPLGPARETPVAHQEPKRDSPARTRILVADDSLDAAETMSMLLQLMGHEVRTAADGQEAVELADSFRPAVALLDIAMPKLNGYDAARRIRAMLPEVLLIAMTGWGQQDDVRKALSAGFDHHLVKPVHPEQLEQLLAKRLPKPGPQAEGAAT